MADHLYCTIGGHKFRLASWLRANERFQDGYATVDPQLRFLPNRSDGLVATEGATFWLQDDWAGGEGFDIWRPERGGFLEGTGVALRRGIGEGLVLGVGHSLTKDSGGSTDFNDGLVLGLAQGSVWTCASDDAYKWDIANGRWGAAVATGGTVNCVSLADGEDTWIYAAFTDDSIRRFKAASNELHVAGTVFTNDPALAEFDGVLYALDGNSLYTIDKVTPDTRTLVYQVGAVSTNLGFHQRRLTVSDVGPVWWVQADNGETYIYQFNHATSTGARIGKLPQNFAAPQSIFFGAGYVFVAYVTAEPSGGDEGRAYIYYQRGAQRGVIGPIRADVSSTPMIIAGIDGDELLFWIGRGGVGSLWAYNLGTGGLFCLTLPAYTGTQEWAVLFGKDVFISPQTSVGTAKVLRVDRETYLLSGSFRSGAYDLAYFDIPKIITELTVHTDNVINSGGDLTGISVTIHTEGGDAGPFVCTAGQDVHRFPVSTVTNLYFGSEISYTVWMTTNGAAVTPVLRRVIMRGISGARVREIVMVVDCSTDGEQTSEQVLANLRTLATPDVVTLSWPFEVREHTADLTLPVTITDIQLPDVIRESDQIQATIRCRGTALVVPSA